MYTLVYVTIAFAFCVAIGCFYRFSIIAFFICFTYLELIDKAWYLNHYYFISLVAFLMIWLPANRSYSVDRYLFKFSDLRIPYWSILLLQIQLAIVYCFAGLAKLKYDWLFLAQPMKIWLGARTDTPVIGQFFDYEIIPYLFSWVGILYDLTIPFFLFWRKTRWLAYLAVIIFHGFTYALFNIGMFPWIMMAATLIFFDSRDWKRILPKVPYYPTIPGLSYRISPLVLLIPYLLLQIWLPIRHHFYEGNVLENEKGFRFAWHVMVMEKNGHVEYRLTDAETDNSWTVLPSQELTLAQEKQMAFQKDMIIQYGKHLKAQYFQKTGRMCSVRAKNWVSLNGRKSKLKVYQEADFR